MRILGVHGVGNYRPGETPQQAAANLTTAWQDALASAGVSAKTSVAYFADLLRPPGRQGSSVDLNDLDQFERELLEAWLAELPLPDGIAAGHVTWPLRQLVSWVASTRFLGRAATEWFVATFFREVAHYLRNQPARLAAHERVAQAITQTQPNVVIAHSLGSVVAYETLWATPELTVPLLVTLGSPLALPHAVFPRLCPAPVNSVGRRPPGVTRWANLADPGDLVAIPPGGISHSFHGVTIDRHDVIHGFDFHLARNYLAAPSLAELLWEN